MFYDIGDRISSAIDQLLEYLGDQYEYTQDGQGGEYINTFYKKGIIVAKIPDSDIELKNKKDMKSYILKEIRKGEKELKCQEKK